MMLVASDKTMGVPSSGNMDELDFAQQLCSLKMNMATEVPTSKDVDVAATMTGTKANGRQKGKGKRSRPNSCTSQYRGVSWFRANKVWKAQITLNGKYEYLGYFDQEEDAAFTYDIRAYQVHGEKAQLNFPERLEEIREKAKETKTVRAIRRNKSSNNKRKPRRTHSTESNSSSEQWKSDGEDDSDSVSEGDASGSQAKRPRLTLLPPPPPFVAEQSESDFGKFFKSAPVSLGAGTGASTRPLMGGLIRSLVQQKLQQVGETIKPDMIAKEIGCDMTSVFSYLNGFANVGGESEVEFGNKMLRMLQQHEHKMQIQRQKTLLQILKVFVDQLNILPTDIEQSTLIHPVIFETMMDTGSVTTLIPFSYQLQQLIMYIEQKVQNKTMCAILWDAYHKANLKTTFTL